MLPNHYETLGVSSSASRTQIIEAYQNKLKAGNMTLSEATQLNNAFQVLFNSTSRRDYDTARKAEASNDRYTGIKVLGLEDDFTRRTVENLEGLHTNSYRPRSLTFSPTPKMPFTDRRSELSRAFWWESWNAATTCLLVMAFLIMLFQNLDGLSLENGRELFRFFGYFEVAALTAFAGGKCLLFLFRFQRYSVAWLLSSVLMLTSFSLLVTNNTGATGVDAMVVFAFAFSAPILVMVALSLSALVRFTPLGRRFFYIICGLIGVTAILFLTATIPDSDLTKWLIAWLILMPLLIV